MKWLMFGHPAAMDEAGDATGEGAGGGSAAAGGAPAADGGATSAEATAPAAGSGEGEAEAKPYLGPSSEKPAAGAEGKQVYAEKDYLDGVKTDEKLFGAGSKVEISQDMVKAMAPTFSELGITPEQASRLANAMAKAQIEQNKAAAKDRIDYFERMKAASLEKYDDKAWAQINAAIDANFDPKGTMNYVIRNSELGADPEFLALLHKLGAAHVQDAVAGAAAGSGAGAGNGDTFAGISKLW
ncbi:MAG: hypothetical protein MJZ81_07545 [Bacteroidales bacterium]|nr:hypothetical protein [Bacteroidales bacterium]